MSPTATLAPAHPASRIAGEPLSLDDVENAARALVTPEVCDFVAGGSGAELTLRANRAAFDRIQVVPRVLGGFARCDTSTRLLGSELSMPVAIAPMAYQRLLHPEGELALARAARSAGVAYVASMLSSTTIEEIAACGAVTWLQLYWLRDRDLTMSLVRRAEAAGCTALVLTVDVPRMGRRLRDIRRGFALPADVSAANLPLAATDSAREWAPASSALMVHTALAFDPTLSMYDVAWLCAQTRLPVLLKGVLHPYDARCAAGQPVAGLVVSNHGGRQLDGALASIDALPGVRDAFHGHGEVLLDSGIRGGADVLKALALGASAVLLGRPALWGLAIGGEQGAAAVLSLLRTELEDVMTLAGCADLAAARQTTVVRAGSS